MPDRSDDQSEDAEPSRPAPNWEELLAETNGQLVAFADLVEAPSSTPGERAAAAREWWLMVNAVLWKFVRTHAQEGILLEPFPYEVLGRLANIAEDLANGHVSRVISDTTYRAMGRPFFRFERHSIDHAIHYIDAVLSGEIDDPSPKKTVREEYNVTDETVRNWLKRREEILVGVPRGKTGKDITQKMLDSGALYYRIGRGAPSR